MKVKEYKRSGYTLRDRRSDAYQGYGQDFITPPREVFEPVIPFDTEEEEDTLPAVPVLLGSIPDPSGLIWFGPTEAGVPSAVENTFAAKGFNPEMDNPFIFRSGEFRAEESSGKMKLIGGLGLIGIGIVGGGVLAIKGKALTTGTKVILGAASLASAGLGSALAIGGSGQETEASSDSERSDDVIASLYIDPTVFDEPEPERDWGPSPRVVARKSVKDEQRLLNDIIAFDSPIQSPLFAIRDRPNPDIVGALCPTSRATDWIPGEEVSRLGAMVTSEPIYASKIGGGFYPADWVEFVYITSKTIKWDDCVHPTQACMDRGDCYDNTTTFYSTSFRPIVTIRHTRWLGGRNIWGWTPGGLGGKERCTLFGYRRGSSSGDPQITWHPPFDRNTPKYLYCSAFTNPWMIKSASSFYNPDDPAFPALGMEVEEDFDNPEEIKGPMGSLMQVWKTMRAIQIEASSLVGTPLSFTAAVIDSARVYEANGWWNEVESFIGKVFGVASFLTEVAVPVITVLNPALGASIGTAITVAINAAVPVYKAVTMAPSQVQEKLEEGWSRITDFRDNADETVSGWLNTRVLLNPDEWRQLEPMQKLSWMSQMIYQGTSNSIGTIYNLGDSPFRITKIISNTKRPTGF